MSHLFVRQRTWESKAQHAHEALHARRAEEEAQRGHAQLRAQRWQPRVRELRHLPFQASLFSSDFNDALSALTQTGPSVVPFNYS